jgi:transmembrane sensor
VEIRPRGNTASLLLQAGERTGFTSSAIDAVQPADRNGLAWTGGFLIAKGMRLEDFLAELSRYSTRPLSCTPAIADLRVSGSYPLADIDKVIDTLSAMLSLEVQTVRRLWGWQAARVNLAPRRGRPAA